MMERQPGRTPLEQDIPGQGLFDLLTRQDELLAMLFEGQRIQNEILRTLRPTIRIPGLVPEISDKELKDQLISGAKYEYETHEYALDTALTDEPIPLDGDFIHAWTDGDLSSIYVKLNNKNAGKLYFARRNPIKLRFFEFYLTHPAQIGKTLDLMIGREASAEAFTAEVSVTMLQKFYTLSSDKDSHFTEAIVQGAKEDEDLTGLLSNKIRLTNVSIISDQALDFYLLFYNTDGFDDTDLDLDTFCGMVQLDLATYGKQLGAAQYYHSVEGLDLNYQDEDGTNELHVALYNASVTGKNAGATGEVAVQFKYELRT